MLLFISIYDRISPKSGGIYVAVSYNRLWKLLIDKGITKTEMRKMAGISTNILAKMGKNETVSMETLAKISTSLQCGLDDIVEIKIETNAEGKR